MTQTGPATVGDRILRMGTGRASLEIADAYCELRATHTSLALFAVIPITRSSGDGLRFSTSMKSCGQ